MADDDSRDDLVIGAGEIEAAIRAIGAAFERANVSKMVGAFAMKILLEQLKEEGIHVEIRKTDEVYFGPPN